MTTRPIELGLNRSSASLDAGSLVRLVDPLIAAITSWSAERGTPRASDFGLRMERLRAGLATESLTVEDVSTTLERVVQLCDKYFADTRTLLGERERELASLVQVLRDTLADLAGHAKTFNVDLMQTTDRMSGLANIDDIRELKRQIATEAKELKNVVVEKQRRDDVLFMQLSRRVDTLQGQLAEAQREAEEDALTGVMNRRGFERTMREWVASASRTKHAFMLGMVEVEDFKAISDTHGHQVADRVLLCVSQRLTADARDKDVVARFDGESFALLMRDTTIDEAAIRLKATMQSIASLEYEYENAGTDATLSFSCCGGVTESTQAETIQDLVKRADRALADAKRAGRGHVVARKRGRFGFLNWAS